MDGCVGRCRQNQAKRNEEQRLHNGPPEIEPRQHSRALRTIGEASSIASHWFRYFIQTPELQTRFGVGVDREAAAIIFVARQRLTVYAEKTTQVIHSQNAKLQYTGTSRTRHSMPTDGSSGSARVTSACATAASTIGESANPASKLAYSQGPRENLRIRGRNLDSAAW